MPKSPRPKHPRIVKLKGPYDEEIATKSRLQELANDVRKKYLQLRFGDEFQRDELEKQFMPITSKLDALISSQTTKHSHQPLRNDVPDPDHDIKGVDQVIISPHKHPISSQEPPHIHPMSSHEPLTKADKKSTHLPSKNIVPKDPTYGVYVGADNGLYIGKLKIPVSIPNSEKIVIGENEFPRTPGLEHLLWNKTVPDNYSQNDLKNYHNILALANVLFRTDHDGNITQSQGSKSEKYKTLIQPYVNQIKENTLSTLEESSWQASGSRHVNKKQRIEKSTRKDSKSSPIKVENRFSNLQKRSNTGGEGLSSFMRLSSSPEFIYYDNIEELIHRLRLLIASRSAGNTNVDNEILNIEEELREAGIIV
jgi:hypothetical protein